MMRRQDKPSPSEIWRQSSDTLATGLWNWALVAVLSGVLANGVSGADKFDKSKAQTKVKQDATAADPEDGGTNDDFAIGEDLSALVLPAEQQGDVKNIDRLQFSQALRGLLLEGMTADGAAACKRHFEAAHRTVPGDPRPAYAYGVALLVQKNSKEALTQFRAAAKSTKAAFLPALQALAWVHLSKGDYQQGLPALIDLARRIEESKGSWPTDHDKEHTAEWLGRLIGYLAGPGTSAEHAAHIEEAANSIEKTLSGKRKQAYEHGRQAIARRHEELKALAARPPDEVLSEATKMREETLAAAETAAATVKQIEEEIRSIKKPIDQQIVDAEKQSRANGTKARKLAKDVPDAKDLIARLSQPQVNLQAVRPSRARPQGVMMQNETAQQKQARETQLASAKQKLQQLQMSIDETKQSMTDARSQRDQAKADLRKALADKRVELAEAHRANHDLAARAKDAEHAMLTPEKLKARVTALEAYVPLDPETEKSRLLATLKSP